MEQENTAKESILVTAAKALGGAAGTVASLGKSVLPGGTATPAKQEEGEGTAKKKKSRLPRRQKKALKKAAALQNGDAGKV